MSAGERMVDIYKFAAANNLTLIGGADPHVGIGGWVQGGGHGPITAKYGMGADQVVEMEVVTADGELLTINEHCESDLFWAMRGAGGSTYAVIISVTVKAYPPTSIATYSFGYNTTANSDTFWSMMAYFHSELPDLSKAGVMGYYFGSPLQATETNASMKGQLYGEFLAPGLSAKDITKAMAPMEAKLRSSSWGDPIYVAGGGATVPDFSTLWSTMSPQFGGYSGRLGSRLLDGPALTLDIDKLKTALKKSTPPPWLLLGHFVAGPGTHSPPDGIPGGSNGVGPGWRKSYTHMVVPRIWTPLNETEKSYVTTQLRDVWTQGFRELAPDIGAYVNEVDPTEPDWQKTLYGENYPRLMDIKKKYDPSGVFWCKNCVGSELWKRDGPFGVENGVGQNAVRLCAI